MRISNGYRKCVDRQILTASKIYKIVWRKALGHQLDDATFGHAVEVAAKNDGQLLVVDLLFLDNCLPDVANVRHKETDLQQANVVGIRMEI